MSVFQAVQQFPGAAAADEPDDDAAAARAGRRLWDEVHTLHYRLPTPADAAALQAEVDCSVGSGPTTPREAQALGRWGATPLRELLSKRLPVGLSCSGACREVLELLSLLEALGRLGPRLVAELGHEASGVEQACAAAPAAALRHVPRADFVSAKLTSKLSQQLKVRHARGKGG
jgi:E3 ubiquitin-protein ligase TRIP12